MIFINNKYTRIYYSIISRAQSRVLDNNVYTEKHHIIPKSLGGNNSKDNLVTLTGREHFICHCLLVKMTTGVDKQKMALALKMLTRLKNTIEITSSKFEYIRRLSSKAHSKFQSNRIVLDATKEKLRVINTGKRYGKRSPETGLKISQATKGKAKSPEHRASAIKNLKDWTGLHHSEETKQKMRKPKEKATCPHCGLIGGLNQLKRYHFDNCKTITP